MRRPCQFWGHGSRQNDFYITRSIVGIQTIRKLSQHDLDHLLNFVEVERRQTVRRRSNQGECMRL